MCCVWRLLRMEMPSQETPVGTSTSGQKVKSRCIPLNPNLYSRYVQTTLSTLKALILSMLYNDTGVVVFM